MFSERTWDVIGWCLVGLNFLIGNWLIGAGLLFVMIVTTFF